MADDSVAIFRKTFWDIQVPDQLRIVATSMPSAPGQACVRHGTPLRGAPWLPQCRYPDGKNSVLSLAKRVESIDTPLIGWPCVLSAPGLATVKVAMRPDSDTCALQGKAPGPCGIATFTVAIRGHVSLRSLRVAFPGFRL